MKRFALIMSAVLMMSVGAYAQGPAGPGKPGRGNGMSDSLMIERKISFLKEKLSLDDSQTASLRNSFVKHQKEQKKIADEHRKAMDKLRKNHSEEIRKILTDEQFRKLQQMHQNFREGPKGNQQFECCRECPYDRKCPHDGKPYRKHNRNRQ